MPKSPANHGDENSAALLTRSSGTQLSRRLFLATSGAVGTSLLTPTLLAWRIFIVRSAPARQFHRPHRFPGVLLRE